MKTKKVLIIVTVLVLSALLGALVPTVTQAATPTGATWDVYVNGMIAAQCKDYPYLCALDANYVKTVYDSERDWLDTLLGRINARYPWYAPKLTSDELTRFAIVKVQIIALEAQKACERGLIADLESRGKFPLKADFDKCDKPHDPYWWAVQYPANVQAVINAFDAGQAFVWFNDGIYKIDRGDYPQMQ